MKRDLDLVRKLLLYFDEKPGPERADTPDLGSEYTENEVKYHLTLMYQAGLLNCEPVRSSTSDRVIYVLPFDLTWAGHEFLDKVRNEGVWAKVRAAGSSRGGSLAFAVVNELATKFALRAAGIPGD